ncbi:L,D-transpeptidase [Moorena sp. SIO4A5]|uniref:L,D-transpeptidase n=1 Tax=Moorena sp. SIO4A5 TaxID=2607838 RepID=UPI0013C679B0|nr:L,D-transpeptidase [Moorena sp. SIO4A5]NEO22189.1 L,D-transpeptidase [Moorena sp. SIO4A5]
MVRGKLLSRSLMLLCLSIVIPILHEQQQVAASEKTSSPDATTKEVLHQNQLPGIEAPKLPLLGDLDLYLPLEEDIPAEATQITRLVIKLSERRVYVYQAAQVLNTYPIAIGKAGWETPTGNFEVLQKLQYPAWEHPWTGEVIPPGPNNPLGDRWIGFWTNGKNYIGFHGTTAEELVGQAVSHGCIRMLNKDVRDLFEKVAIGTPVIVQP